MSRKKEPWRNVWVRPGGTRGTGLTLVEPKDKAMIELLGVGAIHEGTALTRDQFINLCRHYGIDPEKEENPLLKAGAVRDVCRAAEKDGVRLMAFLAGRRLLERGRDPVQSLAEMLLDFIEDPVEEWPEEDAEAV